jgi:hypothetical protein
MTVDKDYHYVIQLDDVDLLSPGYYTFKRGKIDLTWVLSEATRFDHEEDAEAIIKILLTTWLKDNPQVCNPKVKPLVITYKVD